MIGDVVTRTGGNVLKVGVALLISTLANTALKQTSNETMVTLARDIRRIKTDINERRLQAGA